MEKILKNKWTWIVLIAVIVLIYGYNKGWFSKKMRLGGIGGGSVNKPKPCDSDTFSCTDCFGKTHYCGRVGVNCTFHPQCTGHCNDGCSDE